jgi:ABC-type nitrate/sulfonate/bicarbonate transport system substrate-binding protein
LKNEGIEAEVVQMTGNVPVAALAGGELDYHTVLGTSVRGAIQGLPLRAVAFYSVGVQMVLVARGDLKSAKDLKGKTVAIGSPGGAPDTIGRRIIKHFGLEPDKDVKFDPGPGGGGGGRRQYIPGAARFCLSHRGCYSPGCSRNEVGIEHSCARL